MLLLAACGTVAADEQAGSSLAEKWVMDVYQPAFEQFAVSARQWAAVTDDLCESTRGSRIYELQTAFTDVVTDYSRVEIFRSDHLLKDKLWNRLFYWPDTRRVGERQLRALLADPEAGQLTVDKLARKSVAVQGFPALERLLFTNDLEDVETAPQCHVVRTIIQNIAVNAEQLDSAWQTDVSYVQAFLHPHEASPDFRNEDEVLRKVMTEVMTGLDRLIDRKLLPLLSGEPRTIRTAPLWKSQRTVAMVTGNVSGIRSLLFDAGLLEQLEMENQLAVEFDYVSHSLDKLKYRFSYADDNGLLETEVALIFTSLTAVLNGIRFTVQQRVLSPLGIGVGFNAEDGD